MAEPYALPTTLEKRDRSLEASSLQATAPRLRCPAGRVRRWRLRLPWCGQGSTWCRLGEAADTLVRLVACAQALQAAAAEKEAAEGERKQLEEQLGPQQAAIAGGWPRRPPSPVAFDLLFYIVVVLHCDLSQVL